MKDTSMNIAYIILFVGIGLLAFTFISAYIFLVNSPSIDGSANLVDVFGSALAPLIGASIRIMYLGIMGWIGAGLTTRGIQLIIQLKRLDAPEAQLGIRSVIKPKESIRTKEPNKTKQSKPVLIKPSQK